MGQCLEAYRLKIGLYDNSFHGRNVVPKSDGQVKKQFILSTDYAFVSARFYSSDWTMFRAFIIYILYAAYLNYLIRWVIVTYILLNISVANSHTTSAYECELHCLLCAACLHGSRIFLAL